MGTNDRSGEPGQSTCRTRPPEGPAGPGPPRRLRAAHAEMARCVACDAPNVTDRDTCWRCLRSLSDPAPVPSRRWPAPSAESSPPFELTASSPAESVRSCRSRVCRSDAPATLQRRRPSPGAPRRSRGRPLVVAAPLRPGTCRAASPASASDASRRHAARPDPDQGHARSTRDPDHADGLAAAGGAPPRPPPRSHRHRIGGGTPDPCDRRLVLVDGWLPPLAEPTARRRGLVDAAAPSRPNARPGSTLAAPLGRDRSPPRERTGGRDRAGGRGCRTRRAHCRLSPSWRTTRRYRLGRPTRGSRPSKCERVHVRVTRLDPVEDLRGSHVAGHEVSFSTHAWITNGSSCTSERIGEARPGPRHVRRSPDAYPTSEDRRPA